MNAVLAFCHFCDLHGPSVLFSTQAFHDAKSLPSSNCVQKNWYGPSDLMNRTTQNNEIRPTETCESCSSFTGSPESYISNDHEFRVSYLSSQYPLDSNVFSMVRHACVRSLSCEVCPGMEGPIYYGDEQRGHVLSHTLFLKDSQARGFKRWYSMLLVMMDKSHLLNSWPFLVPNFQTIIRDLQDKTKKVYKTETAEGSQRTIRLNSLSRITTPGNFRRQRGNVKGRSLVELTNEKDVFKSLHAKFVWILQALGSRLSERLVEGLPSEDTLVDLEQQEELSSLLEALPELDLDSDLTLTSLKQFFQLVGRDNFKTLAYHVVTGSQIIVKGEPKALINSILHCLQELLPRGCCKTRSYSSEYTEGFNLIGIDSQAALPSSFSSPNSTVILQVTCSAESLSSNHFSLSYSSPLPDKVPQFLMELMKAIQDPNFPVSALKPFLVALKESWMNKVKVIFAYLQGKPEDDSGLAKLNQVFGIQPQDLPLIEFWKTGLSHHYKRFVFSTVASKQI